MKTQDELRKGLPLSHEFESRKFDSRDCDSLIAFFAEVSLDPALIFFSPHPFTSEKAHEISCEYKGNDLYIGLWVEKKLVGYGLLRGWDEGYLIPSLGIYLSEKVRSKGIGSKFLSNLHEMALTKGAKKVMLKVLQENGQAKKMYEKAGYVFENEIDNFFVGHMNLLDIEKS
jgi:ribosomal protein S18 acetylase RimI-like enzyme